MERLDNAAASGRAEHIDEASESVASASSERDMLAVSPALPSPCVLGYRRRMDSIRYEWEPSDALARITLDDGKANVMSVPFFDRIAEALDRAERDHARAVLFAGRPGMFSGGLDLKLMPTLSPPELRTLAREFAHTMLRIFTFPAPTVAALTGHAIAGGAILALACDRRVATDGPYRLHVNEVAIGIPVPTWMALIAMAGIPPAFHVEAILHARAYSPREASERGIVHAVTDAGTDVISAARDAARHLNVLAPAAYAETKRRMRSADVTRVLQRLEDELPG